MAITGTELLILGAIIFLVIMFRPNTIVDLSKPMGRVVREFKLGGKRDSPEELESLFTDTAERLGIRTDGKKADLIEEEILAKAKSHQH